MINFFIPSKKTLILIAGLFVLIVVFAILSLFQSPPPRETLIPSPSPYLPSPQVINNFPDASLLPEPSPELVYSPEVLEQDFERLNAGIPLDQSDAQIRSLFISRLEGQSGFLQQTPAYNIKYIKTRNIFMVEILSADAGQAKTQALDWFKSQGLSTRGICNLPVSIYLSREAKNQLESQNQTFNPIPEGCQ